MGIGPEPLDIFVSYRGSGSAGLSRVQFGSESAWWNDDSDAYFDLYVSDGALMIQMMNFKPNRCARRSRASAP